jgi:GT2 family glycosyltransferase
MSVGISRIHLLSSARLEFGVIVIGRNEGERLKRCIKSISTTAHTVYVDSGSTDGSPQWAREQGVDVVVLPANLPFTAARARNLGFKRLRAIIHDLQYVQFIDGDCELANAWLERAISFLNRHPNAAAVCGRRRERYPNASIYNWLCDQEWNRPAGDVPSCGGDVMIRVQALESVGGYRDDLIAGEEPELCVRLRAAGWHVWRLESEMTVHDAAMRHFGQWWRRIQRSGYAYAQGVHLHGATPERYRVWEVGRTSFWGIVLPIICLFGALTFGPWGWVTFLVYPLQCLRQTARNSGRLSERALLAIFQMLARFAEASGQMIFVRDHLLGRRAHLIEYK